MEHDEFPPADEMMIDELDREDVLLAIRWEKSGQGRKPGDRSR
jgi:hypothetical protein